MTALLVVVVLGFTAFAVDLGLNRVAARDMQAVADAVALDTARSPALASCSQTQLTTKANQSLARQSPRIGEEEDLVVTPGRVDAAGNFTASSASCNAVRITAATSLDFAFAPVIGTDSGSARRRAVAARSEPAVCFSAGTKALSLSTSGSALGPVLDEVIRVNGLDVVGYKGVVDLKKLSVPLTGLDAALSTLTGDSVVDLTTVSLGDFLLATATVLRNQDSPDAVLQATLLESIAARAGDLTLQLGDILDLGTNGSSALGAQVNALDLVAAAIVGANGTNALRVDRLNISLPLDLVNGSTRLVLIEPPQIACGTVGAVARTAQVRIDIAKDVRLLGLPLSSVSMGVEVAQGRAELTGVRCESPQQATVQGTTGVARVVPRQDEGRSSLTVLGIASVRLLGEVGTRTGTHVFPYPPAPDLTQHYGGGSRIILQADLVGLGLIGLLVNTLLDVVNALTGALDLLVQPILQALGIRIGTMDVTMLGTPRCDSVRLAG